MDTKSGVRRLLIAIVSGIALLSLTAISVVYGASQWMLSRRYGMLPTHVTARVGAAAVAEGKRLATTFGCRDCHASDLHGAYLEWAGMTSRNLTRLTETYSDADLDRAIRQGLHPNGTSVASAMPSDMYRFMRDDEAAAILTYLRSLPHGGPDVPEPTIGFDARWAWLAQKPNSKLTAREYFDEPPAMNLGPATAEGRRIAISHCAECHAGNLKGDGMETPDLAIVAGYNRTAFFHFLRTGKATDEREVPLMSDMARARFRHFSDSEIDALYDYLSARARKILND